MTTHSKTRVKTYNAVQRATIECGRLPTIESGENRTPTAEVTVYTGDQMQLDGFQHPVVVDIATLIIPDRPIPLLLNHNPDKSVGHSTDISKENNEVTLTANLSAATDAKREVIESARGGFPWGASLTVDFGRVKKVPKGATVTVNGREFTGPVNVIYHSRLRETSFVPVGGDIHAAAVVSAQLGEGDTDMTFEEWVAEQNVSLDGIGADALIALKMKYDELYPAEAVDTPAEDEPEPTAEAAEGEMDEEEKKEEPVAAAAKPTAQAAARKSQLHQIRTATPPPPSVRVSARPSKQRVIEAALCRTYGIDGKVLADSYSADELTEADSPEYRGYGIKRAFVEALQSVGHTVSPFSFSADDVAAACHSAAFRPTIKASGFSTVSLSNLLGAVANKRLLQDFNRRESTAVKLMKVGSVTNYQQTTAIRPSMAGDLQEVGTDGEIQHMTMAEETYTNQAHLYAAMLQLAEQHIVNDELGGFLSNADRLSYAAYKHREKAFFTLLLGNVSSFYSSTHANLVAAGSVEALSIDGITSAQTLFMNQTDSNGDPIDVMPKYLLTSSNQVPTARTLMNATLVNEAATAGSPAPNYNPHTGLYEVLSSPWMSASTITGYSTTAWYLFADPNDLPAYEVVYLNGQSTPTVETSTAAFNQFGVQMRVSFRYGIAEVDYRGAVKSDGAD